MLRDAVAFKLCVQVNEAEAASFGAAIEGTTTPSSDKNNERSIRKAIKHVLRDDKHPYSNK
jgi:hypothetical protein